VFSCVVTCQYFGMLVPGLTCAWACCSARPAGSNVTGLPSPGGWAASACICRGTCNTYLSVITVLFARLVHALGAT
jgi:hypothetical protein